MRPPRRPDFYIVINHDNSAIRKVCCLLANNVLSRLARANLAPVRVVSRFSSSRFHPKSRRLFSFYFCNIVLRTDLLTFRVAAAVFGMAGGMRRLPRILTTLSYPG